MASFEYLADGHHVDHAGFQVRRLSATRVWTAIQPPGGKTVPHCSDQWSAGFTDECGEVVPSQPKAEPG